MNELPDLPAPPKAPKRRYRPDEPLPSYRFVPGGAHPHPTHDDDGHMRGRAPLATKGSHLAWMVDPAWLYGVDLFNHWYFWEAHEVWEPVWKSLDKASPPGVFVQGLMRCAGALLKVHAGELEGVLAFWGQAEVRLGQVAKAVPELFGVKTKPVFKGFASYFKPAVTRGALPALDKRVPSLKLRM